jgi:hypothetical protein
MILSESLTRKLTRLCREQWHGYLTPVEIMTLLQRKKLTCYDKTRQLVSVQEDIDAGICKPVNFYFMPDKELRAELGSFEKPKKFTN